MRQPLTPLQAEVADVHLVLMMVEGLLVSNDEDDRGPAVDRGLTIALAGLRP